MPGVFALASLMSGLSAPAQAGDEIVDGRGRPELAGRLEFKSPNGTERAAIFDDTDTLAALEGIGIALTQVGDGGSYVWHGRDGRLSGMAQPHESFKNSVGLPCRHLTVVLNSFDRSRRIEGVACRSATGRWQLDG
jgi:surface antigen